MIEPIYYAVFYDVARPKNHMYAMNKRVLEKQYNNLTDDCGGKEIELRSYDDKIAKYRVLNHCTFSIFNSVDNHYFVVCECEKIKEPASIFK